MGTRHLTAVYIDGQYKVAQYGHWDGYPEGAGLMTLNFARTLANKNRMDDFTKRVRAAQWFGDSEIKQAENRNRPQFDSDIGADVLNYIMTWPCGVKLLNSIEFAADSLMCEWVWVIDLDKNTFEGFKGFNKTKPLRPDDRFYFLRDKERDVTCSEDKYYGVILAATWSLDNLPTDDEFLNAFHKDDDNTEGSSNSDKSETLSVQANISIKLTKQDIDDIMTTALEEGITHWCRIVQVVEDGFGERVSDQISSGGKLRFNGTWELSLATLMDGIKMYIESDKCSCIENGSINVKRINADDADRIVQYAVFGELIFSR